MKTFAEAVEHELASARKQHPGIINSVHEAVAVIEEEFLEFRMIAYQKHEPIGAIPSPAALMWIELVQMAAMCQRAAEDCQLAPHWWTKEA